MVCFTKRKKKGKKGISIEYLHMVEMKPLVESRIPFFWFLFCALGESKGSLFCGSWEGDICFSLGR